VHESNSGRGDMMAIVVKMERVNAFKFNMKVYRCELLNAITIESSVSVNCGEWCSVGGKDDFLT